MFRDSSPGAPLAYFNDMGVQVSFLSEILAKSDFLGSMKDPRIFWVAKKNRGTFFKKPIQLDLNLNCKSFVSILSVWQNW